MRCELVAQISAAMSDTQEPLDIASKNTQESPITAVMSNTQEPSATTNINEPLQPTHSQC